jgi:tRNA nucleotidyltransferase (CCA-adding enzyme)
LKTYVVGGAVRDELLGLSVRDRDHVVVGSTPEEMVSLGYQPVGRDFPVFLHPQTHEEYALARTERNTARGYRGFTVYAAPDVTLEDDLVRRDLTINAMARDDDGMLIDPFRGERDLREGILRHVSPAFIEDPVRILRVARFVARFGFSIAPETLALMRHMVDDGEADALVAERVWQEFSKGLMEPQPWLMFNALAACGLLARIEPELDFAFDAAGRVPQNAATRRVMGALRHAVREQLPLEARFALLALALKSQGAQGAADMDAVSARFRASTECRDAAMLVARHAHEVPAISDADPAAQLALLEAGDAFRRPGRLRALIAVCECARFGDAGWVDVPYPPRVALERALAAARSVNAGEVARANPGDVATALRRARTEAIARVAASSAPA